MATDVNFYPERGDKAWPAGCPCCGEVLRSHVPETEDEWEYWTFACGAELYLDCDRPAVAEDCPDAMDQHLEGIVVHKTDAA